MSTTRPVTTRPDLPGLINGPVLLVSALLASPAAVLLSQGLVSVTEMLTRYLFITGGCMVLWMVVRTALIAFATQLPPEAPAIAPSARDEAITGVVLDPVLPDRPEPVDPEALDLSPEELIALTLRKAHQPEEPIS